MVLTSDPVYFNDHYDVYLLPQSERDHTMIGIHNYAIVLREHKTVEDFAGCKAVAIELANRMSDSLDKVLQVQSAFAQEGMN